MKPIKKKGWAFYLLMFGVFTVVDFLVNILFDHDGLRSAVIGGLVSGVVFTILWWFIDQGHEQIKSAAKEDEAERKRRGQPVADVAARRHAPAPQQNPAERLMQII